MDFHLWNEHRITVAVGATFDLLFVDAGRDFLKIVTGSPLGHDNSRQKQQQKRDAEQEQTGEKHRLPRAA